MPDKPASNVDGISPAVPKNVLSRARFAVVTFAGIPYALYFLWSFFLLAVLPDANGAWDTFIPIGKLIAMIFGGGLVLVGIFGVLRIGKAGDTSDRNRYGGFARIAAFVLPGVLMSFFVPYWIAQEPPLPLAITSPAVGTELVAPLSISFSAEEAAQVLRRRNLSTKSYHWDFNGDGTIDEETVTPESTAYFDRQGGYMVLVTLKLGDGSTRTVKKRIVIPKAVFSYSPFVPVVDDPVKFSIAHLIPEDKQAEIREVQWDFDDDGVPDEKTTELETTHTFVRIGDQRVSVAIFFVNQTQNMYFRTLRVSNPLPNPFEVSIETTPTFLESPAPFQVVFELKSDEDLQDVTWDFDDNSPEESGSRKGHTFRNRRVYQVKAKARNLNGEIAKATKHVKVVENLSVPDLAFDGSHQVIGDRIEAEAPVAVTLTPKTIMPLVEFWWEAPNAVQVTSTDTTLNAVYREEGTYNLVLLGKDAEGRVMRRAIVLTVNPKSTFVDFQVRPTQPVAPQIVTFDASESFVPDDQITGFIWNFGENDQEEKFGDAREEHEYTKAGSYTVTLVVNTISGHTETVQKTVTVRAPELKACFSVSRSTISVNSGVLFDWSCTTGKPVKVVWQFGDGAEATSTPGTGNFKIDHVYERAGNFEIKLTIEDSNNTIHSFTQRVTVQ